MREIKFRAWDKKDNCWANLDELSDWGSASFTACIGAGNNQCPYKTFRIESDERYKIQEYIGLKDKNGKEIYEGDVVMYDYGNPLKREIPNPKVREVIFIDGIFCLKKDEYHYSQELNTPVKNKVDYCEIIGNIYENNIYENEELLK